MVGLTGPSRHHNPVIRAIRNGVGGFAILVFKRGGWCTARIDYIVNGGAMIRAIGERRPRHVRYREIERVVPLPPPTARILVGRAHVEHD